MQRSASPTDIFCNVIGVWTSKSPLVPGNRAAKQAGQSTWRIMVTCQALWLSVSSVQTISSGADKMGWDEI